ncbi:MAG: branched-chain amino acid aminotransferase [Oscillospiraceae bacterium]|nr:branched-chain amino acid aminotransferase [Oscillospiraceae bacterium]
MEIKITKNPNPAAKPTDESQLGFGKVFTDHMLVADWDKGIGWHDFRIEPFAPITIHPASTVLHYGVEIFEGLKAYRTADGKVQMFRPIENAKRLNSSAERLAMPTIDPEVTVECIRKLVEVDAEWVPHNEGTSLYIRPFMFADEEFLGVHGASHYRFMVILSPSGSYYKGGIAPVKIMIEDQDVRAVRGGTGYTKCGGNYAASMRAGERAEAKGYTQVLWLDGVERKYIEEVGAMNIMFKIDGKVVTPALNGSILPGITRKSIIELLHSQGVEVEERQISIDELVAAAESGKLEEVWGCGTAAVVSPVGVLMYMDKEYVINNNVIGPVTQKLYDDLTGIQWGRNEDKLGWVFPVC